jgi:hypothetical protein
MIMIMLAFQIDFGCLMARSDSTIQTVTDSFSLICDTCRLAIIQSLVGSWLLGAAACPHGV